MTSQVTQRFLEIGDIRFELPDGNDRTASSDDDRTQKNAVEPHPKNKKKTKNSIK